MTSVIKEGAIYQLPNRLLLIDSNNLIIGSDYWYWITYSACRKAVIS
jgi:hypothetical protein